MLRDAAVPGLQLRVFAKRKAWYLYYRTQSGTQRKPKLGEWPAITIEQARKKARDWYARAAMGEDPSKKRQDAIASPTFNASVQRFWAKAKLKPTSAHVYRFAFRIWGKHIGGERMVDIDAPQIERVAHKLASKYAISSVNMTIGAIAAVFREEIRGGLLHYNPTKNFVLDGEENRERYLSADEFKRLAEALDHYHPKHPEGVAVIRLLALTGARVSEITGSRREWLRGEWLELPDSKTGKKRIYMPPQALAIIEATPSLDGRLIGISNRPQRCWYKVRDRAGLKDFRLHDLRHSFASEALAAGLSLEQIGGLLGHKSPQTTKRYAHLIDESHRTSATQVANMVAARMQI